MKYLVSPLALLTLLLVGASCTSGESEEARARGEIEAMLAEYLPGLARAYAESSPLLLRDWVAEKEIARVHKRIEELADQGRRLEPVFRTVTVESIRVWGHANAYVTTVEVWDIRSVAIGSEVVVQQFDGQSNRVRYQMKKDEGRWRVLFRTVAE